MSNRGLLHSPVFDALLIVGAPLAALLVGYAFSQVPPDDDQIFFLNQPALLTSIGLKAIIHSHLVIVFFRSHGNGRVRQQFPLRFLVAPLALLVATTISQTALAIAIIVSVYWDAYHSSLQTFGIGRIYDQKIGADVFRGRALDIALCHLIYLGPMLTGPLWGPMAQVIENTEWAGQPEAAHVAAALRAAQPAMQTIMLVVAPIIAGVYVVQAVRRARKGEPVPWLKYVLFATTAVACVAAWSFDSFGKAFTIVNVFHAVQYFAIVWWSERKNLAKMFGVGDFPFATAFAALGLVVAGLTYGFWFAGVGDYWTHGHPYATRFMLSLTNSVALLHFWYDGFIWSVRKHDV